jgi:hypothetical protein
MNPTRTLKLLLVSAAVSAALIAGVASTASAAPATLAPAAWSHSDQVSYMKLLSQSGFALSKAPLWSAAEKNDCLSIASSSILADDAPAINIPVLAHLVRKAFTESAIAGLSCVQAIDNHSGPQFMHSMSELSTAANYINDFTRTAKQMGL